MQVVGLAEGYHGDTLGAMDAVAPSPYNGRQQMPWYRPRGLFLDPPTVALVGGEWVLRLPAGMEGAPQQAQQAERGAERAQQGADQAPQPQGVFASQGDVFALSRDASELAARYRQYILDQMAQHAQRAPGERLAACILEPVLQVQSGEPLEDRSSPHSLSVVVLSCAAGPLLCWPTLSHGIKLAATTIPTSQPHRIASHPLH
jgi:dethiobiotin synthetase/adenosylmethionine--8-amino-7-oxononanoate aminotransferase